MRPLASSRAFRSLAVASLVLLPVQAATAAGIFVQPPLDGGDNSSAEENAQQVADDFTLAAPAVITRVRWWGAFVPGGEPSPEDLGFAIRLFEDQGGLPAADPLVEFTLASAALTRVDTSLVTNDPYPVVAFTAVLPMPVPLDAGQTYYLSISGISFAVPLSFWSWLDSNEFGEGLHFRRDSGEDWAVAPPETDLAFELIPEPATGLLVAAGLVAVGLNARGENRRRVEIRPYSNQISIA